ncbi:hypothetical protein EON67_12405, partial [archaeon]
CVAAVALSTRSKPSSRRVALSSRTPAAKPRFAPLPAATNPEYAAALNYAAYGDVTGATGAGGTQVIDIRGADLRPAWDAAALQSTVAAAQHAAKKNAGVATRVWNSTAGSVQQTMEPSRTQKRKHQINALAAHAQAQALELADQRGSANRSRATAYARYGW